MKQSKAYQYLWLSGFLFAIGAFVAYVDPSGHPGFFSGVALGMAILCIPLYLVSRLLDETLRMWGEDRAKKRAD
jgi:hypothetical protein